MKNQTRNLSVALALLALSTLNSQLSTGFGQGTAFTYQGQLQNDGSPADGSYDMVFTLFATNIAGVSIAGPVTNAATAVSDGFFTTTIDFGPGAWDGQTNWLEIAVSTNGANAFSTLAPREQIMPVPYAIFANTAINVLGTVNPSQLSGPISLAQLPATVITNGATGVSISGAFIGNGSGLTNLNSARLTSNFGSNFYLGPAGNTTTSGADNTANGYQALFHGGTYSWNTANGAQALYENTSGTDNTATGFQTLYSNMSGGLNTATGVEALQANTIGSQNTANGSDALYLNTTGSYNTANGAYALYSNTTGNDNTANGWEALYNSTTGVDNMADGYFSLLLSTKGSFNTAAGVAALLNNTSGSNNIALGYQAGYSITTGSSNIDIGNVGVSSDSGIIRIGTPGIHANTFIAGVINGNGAGLTNLNASQLTGTVPVAQLPAAVVTNNDTAVTFNTLTLDNTLNLPDPVSFDAAGNPFLYSSAGNGNLFIGDFAGASAGEGARNTACGDDALGSNAGGSNNIALGYQAGYNFTGLESSNIDIGNEGVAGENDIIRIGAGQTATYLAGNVYASGAVFSNGVDLVSDRNAKENFVSVNPVQVLDKVTSMPVTEWNYKTDTGTRHIGPMAQDFYSAFNVGTDDKHISMVDEGGVALAAIQGLNRKVENELKTKDAEIQRLEQQNDSLAEQLSQLLSAVKSLEARNAAVQ